MTVTGLRELVMVEGNCRERPSPGIRARPVGAEKKLLESPQGSSPFLSDSTQGLHGSPAFPAMSVNCLSHCVCGAQALLT